MIFKREDSLSVTTRALYEERLILSALEYISARIYRSVEVMFKRINIDSTDRYIIGRVVPAREHQEWRTLSHSGARWVKATKPNYKCQEDGIET